MDRETQVSAGVSRPIILVADDEPAIRDITARVIAQFGIDTMQAGNGAMAVECVKNSERGLVCAILDIQMPVMNGADAAEMIRQIAPELPIVLMSSGFPATLTQRIRQLGNYILAKPFSLSTLRSVLVQVVGGETV